MESEEVDNVEGGTIEEIHEEGEAEALEVPVSHIQTEDSFEPGHVLQLQVKGKYYKQTYRSAWEQMPDFKGWLRGVEGEPTRAYCTYCQKTLHAHRLSLLKHTCTIRHQKAAQLHNSRKPPKKPSIESEFSSSEDEGAKVNDISDPPFDPLGMKTRKSSRLSTSKTETERYKRRSSDIEYYNEDDNSSNSSVYEYKLPKSIINLKKQKGIQAKDANTSSGNKSKNKPIKNIKKVKKTSLNSSVQDEVTDAINQLQSLSDSIHVKEDDEFDIFGRYIGSQLKQLSLMKALRAKQRIYSFLSDLRIAEINEMNSSVNSHSTVPVAYISVPSTVATTLATSTTGVTVAVANNQVKKTDLN